MFKLEDGKWSRVSVASARDSGDSILYVEGAEVGRHPGGFDRLWIRPGKDGCMVALRVSEEEMKALREKEEAAEVESTYSRACKIVAETKEADVAKVEEELASGARSLADAPAGCEKGEITDVKTFNHALTPEEVLKEMEDSGSRSVSTETGVLKEGVWNHLGVAVSEDGKSRIIIDGTVPEMPACPRETKDTPVGVYIKRGESSSQAILILNPKEGEATLGDGDPLTGGEGCSGCCGGEGV